MGMLCTLFLCRILDAISLVMLGYTMRNGGIALF
jgi:hypothetical protein